MSTNTLVAASVDTATPLSGTGLLESGSQLAAAIESGSWVEGTLAGVGVALDTAAMVIDPLGSLIGAGLGWLIDHLEPLKGWFNDFTGDAGEVAAFGQTWANIQAQLQGAGDELTRILGDVDELAGEAMDAYRRFQAEASQHLAAAASWAGAMSTGLQIAGTIVQAVHDVVRDVLSQLVGSIIAWAAEAVFTLGLATPVIVAQVSTKVASWSAKVGTTVMDALRSIGKLVAKLGDLSGLMRQASSLWESVLKGGSPSATHPHTPQNPRTPELAAPPRAPIGSPLTPSELDDMVRDGYHSTIFSDQAVQFYDHSGATLGPPGSNVWAMPTEDAVRIHTPADAARETGMAPMAMNAYVNGGDIYAVHFPIDPAALRRPTVADSGGWEHFYPDPTNTSTVYGHTAVNTGTGAFLVNQTRETLVAGGNAVPPGAVLARLADGAWTVVRRYP
jgi:hypothetical protein